MAFTQVAGNIFRGSDNQYYNSYGGAPLSKNAFYSQVSNYANPANLFANNPYGISYQELQGLGVGQTPGTPAPSQSSGGSTSSGGGYSSGGNYSSAPAFNPALYNAQWDTQMSQLQNQLNTLPAAQQQAQSQALNSYQTNLNNLDVSNAQGTRNLNQAETQVNQAKGQSLQQLKDQVAQMYNSYASQPGVGDSSASSLIANALGGQASKGRYSVLQNATNQQQSIGNQRSDLATSYQQQHNALDSWKAQTLNDIASKFLSSRQDIENQIAGASAQKAAGLAQQNAALTQAAISALQNLQGVYAAHSQQLTAQYQNVAAPTVNLPSNLTQFAVQPINADQLKGIQSPVTPDQSGVPDLTAPILKKSQDQFAGV